MATTRQKLDALKNGRELPVDVRAMAFVEYPGTDERAVLTLAREYQRVEDPNRAATSWACQERAADYFNARGLARTIDEIIRIGGLSAIE